jgi:DNA-binding transcriptional LysR family regulator
MQPQVPNWQDLRIFLEVVRTGSFSKSARGLHMDVSTVSRHIAYLEQCLNMPVFERDSLGLRTTARGRMLIAHVEAMESQALALSDAASIHDRTPAGAVRLGTMEGIASFYLAPQFVAFRKKFPRIDIELVTSANHVHVSHREADVFLSFFPAEGKGLELSPVGEFRLHLYASPGYLEAHAPIRQLEDLAAHDFVSYIEDLVQLDTVLWLRELVPKPTSVFSSSSMVAQMFSAAAGGGVVMLPTFMHAERLGLVRILEDQAWLSRTIWMTVHKDQQYMPRVKAVTQFLREILERDFKRPPGVREG